MDFSSVEAICRVRDPLNWTEEKEALMVKACREMAAFHAEKSPETKWLYERNGFDPMSLRSEKDFENLPFFGVTAMKYFLLLSLPEEQAVLKLTSSGTRGQKTQIWFDQASLDRAQSMLDVLWEQEGLVSQTPTNYACFIYDPEDAKDLGIAFSVKNEERFAPVKNSFFSIRKNQQGEWEFQKNPTLARLRDYVDDGSPVRVLGAPGFIYELILALKEKGERLTLPPNSYMLTGGGWKAAEDKSITREAFREEVYQWLGIPDGNIRDGFGMAEHAAPYIECRRHKFHVPVYNRVLVRDPVTFKVVPNGELGLLELITPLNAMMPNLAVLSTDLGCLDAKPCGCGWASPTFSLIRRGGIQKHKGCAITADELVKRG